MDQVKKIKLDGDLIGKSSEMLAKSSEVDGKKS